MDPKRIYPLLLSLLLSFEKCHSTRLPTVCVYRHHHTARLASLSDESQPAVKARSATNKEGIVFNVTSCLKLSDYCYTLWKEDEFGSQTVISQGCWESSSQDDCNQTPCVSKAKVSKDVHQQSQFCCCSGDLCNLDVAIETVPDLVEAHDSLSQTVPPSTASVGSSEPTAVTIISVSIILAVVVVGSFLLWQTFYKRRSKESSSQENEADSQSQSLLPSPCFDSLKLVNITGQGRYGTVWQATLNEREVAVKVFNSSTRCYFLNEREIYNLCFMDHASIIGYVGHQEYQSAPGCTEYRLILEYAPFGCLQDFLRQNSVDWPSLCLMGRSVARGLAHLHVDYQREDQKKLSVAHRDVNSRNVLVKADLTCCLCDLGFAIQTEGAHYYYQGEQQHAETTSLTDVGTLRYMAPEILEGAVNLRECESSLKQIDVYALGLVLWEISYRCYDLYPNKEAPSYLLPFEDETGPHPTLEQMKTLVCRHKARPLIPNGWRENCASIRLLKDTLEDAWDQDAEARLTSLCIEERWTDLPVIWERERHKGLSPNLRANVVQGEGNHHQKNEDMKFEDVAEGNLKNNCLAAWPPSPRPLQPHQGRNPCMERNTMAIPLEEFSVIGNALVDRSFKQLQKQHQETAIRRLQTSNITEVSPSAARVVNPIPYVQNAVRDSAPVSCRRSDDSAHSLGQTLANLFWRKSKKGERDLEENQRLCSVASSPSDVDPTAVAAVVVKSNNQDRKVQQRSVKLNNRSDSFTAAVIVESPSDAIDGCDSTQGFD